MKVLQAFSMVLFALTFLSPPACAGDDSIAKISLFAGGDRSEKSDIRIGVYFKMEPGWYIYWENPGDAGISPAFTWETPDGLRISEILYPVPERFDTQGLISFGYKNEAMILAEVKKDASIEMEADGTITVHASWMVCKESCIVEEGSASIDLNEIESKNGMIDIFMGKLPKSIELAPVRITEIEKIKGERDLTVLIHTEGGKIEDFFPGPVENFILPHDRINITDNYISLILRPYSTASELNNLSGLIFIDQEAYQFTEPVTNTIHK